MSEKIPFNLKIDGERFSVEQDMSLVYMFRDEPEKDYLDVWTLNEEDKEKHIWLFNRRALILWIGRCCTQPGDKEILKEAESEWGYFKNHTGWLARVFLEDGATPQENEMYTQSLLFDLNKTDFIPEEFEDAA